MLEKLGGERYGPSQASRIKEYSSSREAKPLKIFCNFMRAVSCCSAKWIFRDLMCYQQNLKKK